MSTARAKYQVFVSSTFGDLHEERQAVVWEILKARQIPAGMESFPATDDRGWKIIERTIDDCDYYVLLVAGRYGTIDPTTGISWTEREYDYARSKGIPVLAFVRDKAHITANNVDTDEKVPKLEAFTKKVSVSHLHSRWTTADDLRSKVASSVLRAIDDDEDAGNPRPGWVRGDAYPKNALDELTRLSKENAELRAKVEATSSNAQKAVLELTLNGVTDPRRMKEGIAHYEQLGTPARNHMQEAYAWMADRASRTLWLQGRVTNTGGGIARNIRARFSVPQGVADLYIARADRPQLLKGNVVIGGPRPYDTTEDVYVAKAECVNGSALVDQRIKSIGVNQDDHLVRFGLVLPDGFVGAELELELHYSIVAEDGAQCVGVATITAYSADKKPVKNSEIDQF